MTQPKIAFILPVRNKARHLERTLRAVFAQTYSPMQIVISDQMSEDASWDIINRMAREYYGPNEIILRRCSVTNLRGMAGLNAHLNDLHKEVEADLFVQSSADDIPHPDRTSRVVMEWQKSGASYVATQQEYRNEDGSLWGYSALHFSEPKFVTLAEHVNHAYGGSCSSAWEPALWREFGPLPITAIQDVLVPMWATMAKGFYIIPEPLHVHVRYADPNNTGLEGQQRHAELIGDTEAVARVREEIGYQLTANWLYMAAQLDQFIKDHPDDERLPMFQDANAAILDGALNRAYTWVMMRDELVDRGIAPHDPAAAAADKMARKLLGVPGQPCTVDEIVASLARRVHGENAHRGAL